MNQPPAEKPKSKSLSPWVHPKAKKWFQELFEESGLVMRLRDVVENSERPVSAEEARILVMVTAILGHEGIWPAAQKKDLQRIAMKLGRLAKDGVSESATAITMGEHKRRQIVADQVQQELEYLRRLAGISNRVSDWHLPESWGQFWT